MVGSAGHGQWCVQLDHDLDELGLELDVIALPGSHDLVVAADCVGDRLRWFRTQQE